MKLTKKQLSYEVITQGYVSEDEEIDIFIDNQTPIWGNNEIPNDSVVCVVNDEDELLILLIKYPATK